MKDTDSDSHRVDEGESLGLYPIRVVAAQTGLGVHTLRAWERRYGLPRPSRTAGTHRLYRAEDIALLRRVQALVARGTPPSRACAIVLGERANGEAVYEEIVPERAQASVPTTALRTQLRSGFVALDDDSANGALSEAFTLFGPELALEQVILPALVDVGSAWAEGRASVAVEHFATTLVRTRLLAAFDSTSRNDRQAGALLGAGPGESHEIPTMALALLLRRLGWRAMFLGANTPLDALSDAIARTRPRLACLSVTLRANVPALVETLSSLHAMQECASTVLSYGGPPFLTDPALRLPLEGVAIYLGDDLRQAADRANQILLGAGTPPTAHA